MCSIHLCEAGWPHSIVEVAREGFRRAGDMLCPLVALLSGEPREPSQIQGDDFPAETMIGGVPGWAMDVHTRQERLLSLAFLILMRPPPDGCGRTSGRPAGSPSSATSFFASRAGSSPIDCAGLWGTNFAAKATSSARIPNTSDDTEILDLARADLPILDEVRAEMAGGVNHAS